MTVTSQFTNMTSSSNFFDIKLDIVTGLSFMPISSLVLELRQFTFIRDWPEIWKSEIPLSESCPISEDWDELAIPHLGQISLMKFYCMVQNARVTAFTIFELLRKNQQEGVKLPPPPPSPLPIQIRVKTSSSNLVFNILSMYKRRVSKFWGYFEVIIS